ncbi:hypothetical protein [Spirosoma fluviale]|uniref:Uncharacterized protein n=1 Tax=Spirosoma fluviale TaxID=1597977 RepID=A0A286GUS9_9BACT|nr:hypothetical protein [Spirosoma fluviale]SOD99232.1 hypothetical protein SAMN06269250_6325 [Spirosoma fluviale]
MKAFINLLVILFIALVAACSKKSYCGKTYSPTQHIDVYLDKADIRKGYITIGSANLAKGFSSMDAMQQKVIELGKSNGADGVIMTLTENGILTQQNGTGVVSKTKKQKVIVINSSSTTPMKEKRIVATFIKYE